MYKQDLLIVTMENIFIKGTRTTPTINFDMKGRLEISGRSIPENALGFFETVVKWSEKYSSGNTEIIVKLEYLNTSTSKVLFQIFKNLERNHQPENIRINWYYEEGDEDVYDTGEYYQSLVNIPFEFFECTEF